MGFEPVHEFFVELPTAFHIGLSLPVDDDIVVLVMPYFLAVAFPFVTEAGGEVTVRHAEIGGSLFDGAEGDPALLGFDVYGYGVCCCVDHGEVGGLRSEVGSLRLEVKSGKSEV